MDKHKCPVCGEYEFLEDNSLDICRVCGWQDDGVQEDDPDYDGGANHVSLNQAKENYKKYGVAEGNGE